MDLRITYDSNADAAYLYLVGHAERQDAPVFTFEATTPDTAPSFAALDWQNGRIVGLEVLDASERLHPDILAAAERLD